MTTVTIFKAIHDQIAAAFPSTYTIPAGVSAAAPSSGEWLEVRTNWIGSTEYAVGNLAVERGFFRVLVCGRLGTGLLPLQTLAEQVIAAFPKGSSFAGAVTDERPSLSGPTEDKDRLIIPVTIRWRATRS